MFINFKLTKKISVMQHGSADQQLTQARTLQPGQVQLPVTQQQQQQQQQQVPQVVTANPAHVSPTVAAAQAQQLQTIGSVSTVTGTVMVC